MFYQLPSHVGYSRRMDSVQKLPDGYVAPSEWPEFINTISIPPFLNPKRLGGVRDIAWRVWPLSIEAYHSEEEPVPITPPPYNLPFRMIMWHRPHDGPKPNGWVQFRKRPDSLIGFADITNSTSYEELWTANARRDRKLWLTRHSSAYTIETIPYSEFKAAYLQGTIEPVMKRLLLQSTVFEHTRTNSTKLSLWGARRKSDGKIVAGMAALDSPSSQGSYNLAAFYLKEARKDLVMTGVVDHWFKESQKKGIRFLQFGSFYQPGDPKSWKGFSNFKAKFGIHYVTRPPTLYKWIRR